jgi:hypothetical protein
MRTAGVANPLGHRRCRFPWQMRFAAVVGDEGLEPPTPSV